MAMFASAGRLSLSIGQYLKTCPKICEVVSKADWLGAEGYPKAAAIPLKPDLKASQAYLKSAVLNDQIAQFIACHPPYAPRFIVNPKLVDLRF